MITLGNEEPKAASTKKNVVATELTPKPEQAPKYEIPLKELIPSKAGVGDLFNKLNEIIRYLNDLKLKPQAP